MPKEPITKTLKWLMAIGAFAVIGLLYFAYLDTNDQLELAGMRQWWPAKQKTTGLAKMDLPQEWKTYTNEQYGVSFNYPSTWQEYKPEMPAEYKPSYVASIQYRPIDWKKEIDTALCINNEDVKWANPTPTKEDCASILASLSKQKRAALDKQINPKSLYLLVFRDTSGKDLKEWLIEQNRIPNSELEDYTPGKDITMAGKKGYFSSTGCCAGYTVAYVIKNGEYVYELGTNYEGTDVGGHEDNIFLQEVAKTFKLTN